MILLQGRHRRAPPASRRHGPRDVGGEGGERAVEGGEWFDVTGDGPVGDSIQRMLRAHAAKMNGVDGWTFDARRIEGGPSLTVHAPPKDATKLKGLGFSACSLSACIARRII
jgi:hypothetical protein